MTPLIFIAALALSVLAFELMSILQIRLQPDRLKGIQGGPDQGQSRRSTWHALLIALWPGRFDPAATRDRADVVSLLRRAGYPYATPGEFYAASIRTFSLYLGIGGLLAGAMYSLGQGLLPAVLLAASFVFLGLRRPYVRLRLLAKQRAGALRSNMLTGLAVLNALLTSGVSVQEALRRTSGVGGPFCNLLGLLVVRMEVEDFGQALATATAHLPDPDDVEAGLFLRDVGDFFGHNRPLLSGVRGLQEAVHRLVVEETTARAALVRQRSGLFGVLSVMGLVIAIIAPFLGVIG